MIGPDAIGGGRDARRGEPTVMTATGDGIAVGWPSTGELPSGGLGWPSVGTHGSPAASWAGSRAAAAAEVPAAAGEAASNVGGENRSVSRETDGGITVSRETADASQVPGEASLEVPEQTEALDGPGGDETSDGEVPVVDGALHGESTDGKVAQPRESAIVARAQRHTSSPLARSVDPLASERWPRPPAPRILTIANQKGGVGKTTTAVNLAAALAKGGLRVLVIDQDPQGNASTALGIEHHSEVRSIYDVLIDEATIVDVVQDCPDIPGLQCVPATIDLAGAEIELVSYVAREMRLQRALAAYAAEVGDAAPDYVIIDCPPSLGLLTINAFVAAAEVLIPIQCEYYALEGLSMLLRNIEMIRRHLNPALHVSTILLTMYDARTRLSQQVASEVREHFPEQVLRTTVPRSVRISEAPSHGQTVLTYDPMSAGSLSYLDAARELAHRAG